jgi:hypothetical protein
VPLGERGRQPDGTGEAPQRGLQVAAHAGRHAEAVPPLGQVGRQLQRVLEGHLGPLGVAGGQVDVAPAELVGGARRDEGRGEARGEEEGAAGGEPAARGGTAGAPRDGGPTRCSAAEAGPEEGAEEGAGDGRRAHGEHGPCSPRAT